MRRCNSFSVIATCFAPGCNAMFFMAYYRFKKLKPNLLFPIHIWRWSHFKNELMTIDDCCMADKWMINGFTI